MNHLKAKSVHITGIAVCAACLGTAIAQGADSNFPTKPIRFIVPTAPGGGSDLIARSLGQKYTQAWGQQVVVDHRPGAGMTIGIDLVAKATPDGHTVIIVNPSHAINSTLMARLPYDAVRDFIPITVIATQAYAVVVSPSLPAKNVRELIGLAKAKPRELSYASSGPGSASHLATEMLSGMTGIEMIHVPYKGTGPAVLDLISGRVQIYINPLLAVIGAVETGRLRVIAVTSAQRVKSLPDIPTVAESGVPGYQASNWYGFAAPAKTPRALIMKLNQEFARIMASPDVRERLLSVGMEPATTTPEQYTEFVKAEIVKWTRVVKTAGIHAD